MKLIRWLLLALLLWATRGESATRPNIIFVLVDDMGYGDLSVYGNAGIQTPHLARLAAEGIAFEQFYASAPICSPSRTAFTTGQYPQRWRITSFLSDRAANTRRQMADFLDPAAPTLARFLNQAGYATGHFGKWHLGGQRNVDDAPLLSEYGFDASLTQFEGLGDRILPEFSRPMELQWKDGRHPLGVASARLGRGEATFVPRASATSRWAERAMDFIKRAGAAKKPFYVNVWPDDPHTPVEPSAALRGDYSARSRYLGVVRELDRDLGVLFDFVRNDPVLRDNTVIIFASDNGPEEGYGSAGGLRGSKGELYEGGIREPFIVWGPGLIDSAAHGSRNHGTVLVGHDLAPTLLAIAGVSPANLPRWDGLDMSAALLGRKVPPRPQAIFWARPPDRPGVKIKLPDLAVREGPWKLLCAEDGGARELFDLNADPGETINRATTETALADRLAQLVTTWYASVKK
jgi:arylsulfatase A-like enzyme